MATTTSRMLLDPSPSLIDLPPLANTVRKPLARIPDLNPAAHSQTHRASSESQAPGRVSPPSRISRRTPVPFLLEAFPAPPSHIPGTLASVSPTSLLNGSSILATTTSWLASVPASAAVSTSPTSPPNSNAMLPNSPQQLAATQLPRGNPPPSSPPTVPLPPIPGPSSVARDLFTTQRALQTTVRSGSPALSRTESQRSHTRSGSLSRLSLGGDESVRGRCRQGSLSSLRNTRHPKGEQSETIAEEPMEEPCVPPPPPSAAPQSPPLSDPLSERRSHDQSRGDSLDILRPSISRVAERPARPDHKPYVEDLLASIDMSDLNAIKSDEGEGDEQASRPFPRFPPLLHSQSQSPIDPPLPGPPYVHKPREERKSSDHPTHVRSTSGDVDTRDGAMSPEITQILSATPRLRKRSSPSRSRDPSATRDRKDSCRSRGGGDVPPVPTSSRRGKGARLGGGDEGICVGGEDQANESDSSLDLHTPLPQLMLRHGMLSPHSKLLPRLEVDPSRLSIMSGVSSSSYLSNASNVSLMSTTSAGSKHPKDARDTPRRRVRHRDGKLLQGGIGLTTGLGWSDSEDEDAPSQLTRRVSSLVLSHRTSSSSVASSPTSPSSRPVPRSTSHSILRDVGEHRSTPHPDEFGYSPRSSLATRSLPSRSTPASRVASIRSTGSSLGRYSTYSTSSVASPEPRTRAGSVSDSSVYAASIASKPDSFASSDGNTGLMPGIREYDDGVTPTRAAFQRSSAGSPNGAAGPDPHTPSSTASSGSLPFPATPKSTEEIPQLQLVYNQDKILPPLPPSTKGKYPSTLTLRSQSAALHRPRTYSNASSVSNSSMLGIPPGNIKSRSASPTTATRQLLAKAAIPAGSPRPSVDGTPRPSLAIPRPSLTIPKSPLSPQPLSSGLPRPTTPSLSNNASAGQGYMPRPLRLAELNQSPAKVFQPGEQPLRSGQVLTYNRNIHDQLKLRSLSVNTGPNRAQESMPSSGGTQMLSMPSPGVASAPSSALSTPVTAPSSPLPSPNPGGESGRPKPRTGTGMVYRTNLSVGTAAAGRIRVPSTVTK